MTLLLNPPGGMHGIGTGALNVHGAGITFPKMMLDFDGQSNSLGHMATANVTIYAGLTLAFPAVQMVDHNSGSFSDPPVYHDEGPRDLSPRSQAYNGYLAGDAGLEVVMARELVSRTSNAWCVAKMCIDGASLISGLDSTSYPTAGPAYRDQHITFVQAKAAAFGVTNLASTLVKIYIQGEGDTGNTYAAYYAAMVDYFAYSRAALGNHWIVLLRLSNQNDLAGNVSAAQESFAADDPRCAIFYGDDLALRDAAHYGDDPYVTLALRATAECVALINGTTVPNPTWRGRGPFTIASSIQGITPTLPRHKANDILLFVIAALGQNSYTLTTANGFAEISGSPQHDAASSVNARLQVFWVRAVQATMDANGGQMPAPIMGDAASDDSKMGVVCVVRGCRTSGNPWDVAQGGTAVSSTAVSFPTVTTTVDNCLVMHLAAIRNDVSTPQFSAWANGALTGITEHVDKSTTSGAGYGIGVAVGVKASHGAIGNTTATLAGASTQALLTLAFSP